MKLLVLCPIPVEYAACREVLNLRDLPSVAGCRAGRGLLGNCEVLAMASGPGKARSASAAAAGIRHFSPDAVLDSGSCAGIEPGTEIGTMILARECYETDISGSCFPQRRIPEMRLPSAFGFLSAPAAESLLAEAVERGEASGWRVRLGVQACGEFLISSSLMRSELYRIFQAAAGNWETAGVFVAALKSALPALSLRVVTDLGDENALRDFRRNIKRLSKNLYRYLTLLLEYGWFERLLEEWGRLERSAVEAIPGTVLP